MPGWSGYLAWRAGLVKLWQRRVLPHPPRPPKHVPKPRRPAPDSAVDLTLSSRADRAG
jgi:hypothetical protein